MTSQNQEESRICVSKLIDQAFHSESSLSENDKFYLPNNIRCASHTFNLLATTDFEKAVSVSPQFRKSHHCAMGKTKNLWNKLSRSSKSADEAADILGKLLNSDRTFQIPFKYFNSNRLGRQLPTPGETRCNAIFDSLLVLLQQDPAKINGLMKSF